MSIVVMYEKKFSHRASSDSPGAESCLKVSGLDASEDAA
jgi:hypothetical protein